MGDVIETVVPPCARLQHYHRLVLCGPFQSTMPFYLEGLTSASITPPFSAQKPSSMIETSSITLLSSAFESTTRRSKHVALIAHLLDSSSTFRLMFQPKVNPEKSASERHTHLHVQQQLPLLLQCSMFRALPYSLVLMKTCGSSC